MSASPHENHARYPLANQKLNNLGIKLRTNALPPPDNYILSQSLGFPAWTEWLAGDGSARCYYRVLTHSSNRTFVLMQLPENDAAQLRAGTYSWIKIAGLLAGHGIFVPTLIATLPAEGAIVIEDYGNTMLENTVTDFWSEGALDALHDEYGHCFKILQKFLHIEKQEDADWCKTRFDRERFLWELNFFLRKFVFRLTDFPWLRTDQDDFRRDSEALADFLDQLPSVFVHRDFHSRNIMRTGKRFAIIDFQDARLGPATYDLASLVFDPYVPLAPDIRGRLVEDGLKALQLACDKQEHDLSQQFFGVALQRQLKAIGSYGFLSIDQQRGDYLHYVQPALEIIARLIPKDPRWPFLSQTLIDQLLNHIQQLGHPLSALDMQSNQQYDEADFA